MDDDRAVRKALQVNLSKQGFQVTLAEGVTDALEVLHELAFDVVLTDVRMPDGTGIDLLAKLRSTWPQTPVVMMTGYSSVSDAVAAMKGGAADYLIKPIAKDELLVVLDRTLEQRSLKAELVELRREVQQRYGFENLIGTTDAMVAVYEKVAAVADTPATVLLTGETGTGKEVLAHAIHYRSPRAGGAFVRVNCAAIPESLIESELFGHERGSFTGAIRQHQGKFEQADGGTILLDEIGEIQPFVQAKLLRVLENGEMSRVGGQQAQRVDVRVIAATNKDLAQEVRAGSAFDPTSTIGSTWSPSPCLPFGTDWTTCHCSSTTSSPSTQLATIALSPKWPRARSKSCTPTTGQATCVSSSTW